MRALLALLLCFVSFVVSTSEHDNKHSTELSPHEPSNKHLTPDADDALLDMAVHVHNGVGGEHEHRLHQQALVHSTLDSRFSVMRSIFPVAVVTSSNVPNAQQFAVEATGPPPLSDNWGIMSDQSSKGRLNLDFGSPVQTGSVAIMNGQGCYYGVEQFRLYASNSQSDFLDRGYGVSPSMVYIAMFEPYSWRGSTATCDALGSMTFNRHEDIIVFTDDMINQIKTAGGYQYYIFLFDDTWGSVDPQYMNYFAIKHIALQSPRRVPPSYPFYKFIFNQTRAQAAACELGQPCTVNNPIELAEIRMWTDLRWVAPVQGLTTSPDWNYTLACVPAHATDSQFATIWCNVHTPTELRLIFNSVTTYTFYEFITSGDDPAMDPASWTLYGSSDLTNWNILDIRSKVSLPLERRASKIWEVDLPGTKT